MDKAKKTSSTSEKTNNISDKDRSISRLVNLVDRNKKNIKPAANKHVIKDHNGKTIQLSKESMRKSVNGR